MPQLSLGTDELLWQYNEHIHCRYQRAQPMEPPHHLAGVPEPIHPHPPDGPFGLAAGATCF